ncbi:MAG: hypothetical protein GY711_13170 [bacterium]|nr:hypothetical protein [bacterium]
MRRTAALLWKEWRDHRALVFLFALLAPFAVWATQAAWIEDPADPMIGSVILPAIAVLFAAVLTAEALCADFASGAADALGRLPVSPRTLFGTKLAFVALVFPALLVWITFGEHLRRIAFGHDVELLWGEVLLSRFIWLIGATATMAVAACASLLRRGFPAVLAGSLMVLGSLVLVSRANDGAGPTWVQAALETWGLGLVLGTASVAFLCTAVGAYSPWTKARDARRIATGALCFCIVGLPAFATGLVRYRSDTSLQPGDPVTVQRSAPSPDGRYVALQVGRSAPWPGATLEAVWLLHVKTHEIRVLPGMQLCMPVWHAMDSTWSRAGELVCIDKGDEPCIAWIEPTTGTVVRTRELVDWPKFLDDVYSPAWCEIETGERAEDGAREYSLHWPKTGQHRTVHSWRRPHPTRRSGEAFYLDDRDLMRCTPEGTVERVLSGGEFRPVVAPDGSLALFRDEDRLWHVVETRTGTDVLDPGDWGLFGWTSRGRSAGVFQNRSKEGEFAIVGELGVRNLVIPGDRLYELNPTPDGGFVAHREWREGDDRDYRIERLDASGRVLEVLYENPR